MTTEVLNTPAAAAVPPALADGATAPAALLQGAFLMFRVAEAGTSLLALPPYMMFSPVQRFAGVVSPGLPVAGGACVMVVWGCVLPALWNPLNFTMAARQKWLTPDFCLGAGVSWKNITLGDNGEEEKKFFFSPEWFITSCLSLPRCLQR